MSEVAPFAAEERRKCIWCLIYLMSGSKAPDYDTTRVRAHVVSDLLTLVSLF